MVLHLNKLESSLPKDTLCHIWLKLAELFWRFFKFSLFPNYTPLEKGPVHLNSLHPKMLCAKFGWNWPSGSGEEDFQILSMHFRYFIIISPWKRAWLFFWKNLNSLCAKFGWNWSIGLEKMMKMWKVYDNDEQILIRKAHLNVWLGWAKQQHIKS